MEHQTFSHIICQKLTLDALCAMRYAFYTTKYAFSRYYTYMMYYKVCIFTVLYIYDVLYIYNALFSEYLLFIMHYALSTLYYSRYALRNLFLRYDCGLYTLNYACSFCPSGGRKIGIKSAGQKSVLDWLKK